MGDIRMMPAGLANRIRDGMKIVSLVQIVEELGIQGRHFVVVYSNLNMFCNDSPSDQINACLL